MAGEIPASPDVLFLAAFDPELAVFRAGCGARPADAPLTPPRIEARAVGIGLVAASAGAARILEHTRPRAVVLLGTCGAYPESGVGLDDVVVSGVVRLTAPAALDGAAQFPDVMPIAVVSHAPLREALIAQGARAVDVATTLAVTVDDTVAVRAGRAAAVEHLEAFAVASACAAAGVPFVALLGVANSVGSRGRAQWRERHGEASGRAAEHALAWLHGGAPGLSARTT